MINKTELVSKYVKEYNGKLSQKKLAEVIHHKHPDLYPTAEHARFIVRKIIGKVGISKSNITKKIHRVEWKGLTLPKPEKNDYSKVILKEKRIGILSDIHIPYYNEAALNAALFYLLDWKPECIILNGDCIDLYHGSNFDKDPRNRDLAYEFDLLKQFIRELKSLFPNTRIIYKAGNHDERYETNILQRVPHFVNLSWMTLETAIHWGEEFKIEVVKNKRIIKAGHLNILHGHEFAKGFIAPVNVSRGFYLRAKANVIAGHHHRISEHLEKDINENMIGAWSTGCLCELNPKYMPINSWQHGFATVEILNDQGHFQVNNIRILNGKIV